VALPKTGALIEDDVEEEVKENLDVGLGTERVEVEEEGGLEIQISLPVSEVENTEPSTWQVRTKL
jgi:hypothetical protein